MIERIEELMVCGREGRKPLNEFVLAFCTLDILEGIVLAALQANARLLQSAILSGELDSSVRRDGESSEACKLCILGSSV
ncbi:hypothetical protein Tco_1202453 [Tanacetum coccineum]